MAHILFIVSYILFLVCFICSLCSAYTWKTKGETYEENVKYGKRTIAFGMLAAIFLVTMILLTAQAAFGQ